jgi:hypothetical protein
LRDDVERLAKRVHRLARADPSNRLRPSEH